MAFRSLFMPASPFVESMNRLQRHVGAELKRIGFRVRERTYNRITDEGLTQVVNFQMGPLDPPGTTYIAGLRENLHGWFTVNLGVYVPEVGLYTSGAARFVQDYHCCVRQRLGELCPEQRDLWWRISADTDTISELRERLVGHGVPFLDRFGSRDAILQAWSTVTENVGAGTPPRIVKAIILAGRGHFDEAQELLRQQVRETRNPGHSTYVRELALKLGLASPPD
jgi:hypothetical protein